MNEFENLLISQTEIFAQMKIASQEDVKALKSTIKRDDGYFDNYRRQWGLFEKIRAIPGTLLQESDDTAFNIKVKIYSMAFDKIKEIIAQAYEDIFKDPKYENIGKEVDKILESAQKKIIFLLNSNKEILEKISITKSISSNSMPIMSKNKKFKL